MSRGAPMRTLKLTRIGLRKDGTSLAVRRAQLRKPRGCFYPARYIRTHAAIAITTACRGSLSQRWSRLFRPFLQATKDHLACRGLMHGGHDDVHTLIDHPASTIHHHHRAVIQIGHALVRV